MKIYRNAKLIPILLGQCAAAATYYAGPNGRDSNPGTATAPVQTLQRAAGLAHAGDTVVVRDGTYGPGKALTGGDGANFAASPVVLRNSGTPSAWITIRAEHKWGAILDCQMRCDSYIDLLNASHIVIEGFVITRGYKEGIHSNDAAHHITLRGNRFEYIANRSTATGLGLDGMYTSPNCHDFIIDGNVFHDIGRTDANWLDHGLYLRGFNFTITNNVFYNIPHGWAIQMADGLSNVLVANNTFAFPSPIRDGYIMLWKTQVNLTIRNNIFYDSTSRPASHAIVRTSSDVRDCSLDHNLIYGAGSVIADSGECSLSGNRVGVNPQFVQTTAPYDFHLQPGSPAIDAGLPVPGVNADFEGTARRRGAACDLGAFEFRRTRRSGLGQGEKRRLFIAAYRALMIEDRFLVFLNDLHFIDKRAEPVDGPLGAVLDPLWIGQLLEVRWFGFGHIVCRMLGETRARA